MSTPSHAIVMRASRRPPRLSAHDRAGGPHDSSTPDFPQPCRSRRPRRPGRPRVAGLFAGFGASFVATTVLVSALLASVGLTTDGLRLVAGTILGLVGLTLALPRLGEWVARRIPARAGPFHLAEAEAPLA